MRLVWYPIGVIKLAEAPKHMAIKNARVGSIAKLAKKYWPRIIARGDKIIATAAFDTNADVINVIKYKIETTLVAWISAVGPIIFDISIIHILI